MKLEIDGKPVGQCLRRVHARTHAQVDGHTENIMHPAPSVGWAVA